MKILLFPFDNPKKVSPKNGASSPPLWALIPVLLLPTKYFLAFVGSCFSARQGLDRGKTRYPVRPEGITSLAETLGWPIWADHRRQKTNASLPHRENLPIGRTGSDHLRDHEGGTTIPILLRPEDQGMGLSEAGGSTGARSFSQQQAILQV